MTAEAGGTMTHEADGAMTHERGLMASELLAPALTGALAATSTAVERVSRAHDDAEAVHDMRVGIRRMRTVLNAGRGLYGRKAAERLIDQLRTVSKATNALRDEEVLGDTIAMLELAPPLQATATAWIERRVALLGELRAMGLAMLDGSGIRHVLGALGDLAARPPKRDQDALDFAREQLLLARRELCALLPEVAARDGVALHRLRIRFKRLRYTAEMLAGSLRASPDEPVLPRARARRATRRAARSAGSRPRPSADARCGRRRAATDPRPA